MEVKKAPKADLENKKSIFSLLGLSIALLLCVGLFSISQGNVEFNDVGIEQDVVEEQLVEITRPEEPPKPEIQKVAAPSATANVLEAVDNSVELEDDMDMFNIEATENTIIDIQPIEVEEELLEEEVVVLKAEKIPTFLGGDYKVKFVQWLGKNTKYPKEAELNNISGRVTAIAVVGTDGMIRKVQILQSPDPSFTEAVTAQMMKSPKWAPAENRGKPVAFQIMVTVNFTQINN